MQRATYSVLRNTQKGFTLLEILLALVLLAVGVIATAGLFGFALESSLDAENTEISVALAQARMEQVKNFAYGSIPTDSKVQVAGFPLFQRQVSVTESPVDLKLVTVTVYWQFKDKEVSQQLITYVSKN